MIAGCCKVHIAGDILTGLNRNAGKDVFRTASLMGRNKVFKSENFLYGCFQMVEVPAACISLVADHDTGPLLIAHRIGS